jgi:predicted HTH transcriptional regulator
MILPIPLLTLPGHHGFHDKIVTALGLCQESHRVDFKESAPWVSLRDNLVKTILGMGNLRDGGIVVVGVSERDANWEITGITEEHLQSYDVDDMLGYFGSFISPFAEIDVVQALYNDQNFLAIQIHEFQELPLVCRSNGPDPNHAGLHAGGVYIRPMGGVPRTTRVVDAQEMHNLLDLAAEKRARNLIRRARAFEMVGPDLDNVAFDRELEGL